MGGDEGSGSRSTVVLEGGDPPVGISFLPLFVELPVDLRQEVLVEQPVDEGGIEVLLQPLHDVVGELVGLPIAKGRVASGAVVTDDDPSHFSFPTAVVALRLVASGGQVEFDDPAIGMTSEDTRPPTTPCGAHELLGGESTPTLFHGHLQRGLRDAITLVESSTPKHNIKNTFCQGK